MCLRDGSTTVPKHTCVRGLCRLRPLSARIVEPLSSYTPRHTWATVARNRNIPLSVISAGMGHSSEKTTQIYLASLESSIIDRANASVLSSLNRKGPRT